MREEKGGLLARLFSRRTAAEEPAPQQPLKGLQRVEKSALPSDRFLDDAIAVYSRGKVPEKVLWWYPFYYGC